MSRWKAAAIHLSISAAIALFAAVLIFGVWYPPPYDRAAGALELVTLLLGVDLVLGPLLTLVVFKTGKKMLRFDLAMIALMQAGAFLYGMSVVVRARPVFIVGTTDRFVLISANELDPIDLAGGRKPEFRSLSWTGPRLVGVEMPSAPAERYALLFSGVAGKDVQKFPKYYTDYTDHTAALLQRAKPLDMLRNKQPDAPSILNEWLRDHHRLEGDVVWLPMTTSRSDLTMLLDRVTGESLDSVPIVPW